MEIVVDFGEKSYNNNGNPLKSSMILRVKPNFFIYSLLIIFLHFLFHMFSFFIFLHFFFIFHFSSFFLLFSSFFFFFLFFVWVPRNPIFFWPQSLQDFL